MSTSEVIEGDSCINASRSTPRRSAALPEPERPREPSPAPPSARWLPPPVRDAWRAPPLGPWGERPLLGDDAEAGAPAAGHSGGGAIIDPAAAEGRPAPKAAAGGQRAEAPQNSISQDEQLQVTGSSNANVARVRAEGTTHHCCLAHVVFLGHAYLLI